MIRTVVKIAAAIAVAGLVVAGIGLSRRNHAQAGPPSLSIRQSEPDQWIVLHDPSLSTTGPNSNCKVRYLEQKTTTGSKVVFENHSNLPVFVFGFDSKSLKDGSGNHVLRFRLTKRGTAGAKTTFEADQPTDPTNGDTYDLSFTGFDEKSCLPNNLTRGPLPPVAPSRPTMIITRVIALSTPTPAPPN